MKTFIGKSQCANIKPHEKHDWANLGAAEKRKLQQYDPFWECPGVLNNDFEAVDHPSHYGGDVVHETIKCLEAWGLNGNARLWNAVKYISRAGKKGNALEDLKKARFYLQREIDLIEGES